MRFYFWGALLATFLFSTATTQAAMRCKEDLQGTCASGYVTSCQEGYSADSTATGCPDGWGFDYCCVPKCKTLFPQGGCLTAATKSSCQIFAPSNQECNKTYGFHDSVCCQQLKTDPSTSNNCLDHRAEGYYCAPATSSCNQGDTQGTYTCGASQICCKSAGSGGGSTGVGSTAPGGTGTGLGQQHPYAFTNPIGYSSFTQLIVAFLGTVQQVVGWLAVIFIVLGGLMYVVSGGSGLANTAKATITWALIGFAIAVAGPAILREIYEVFTSGGTSGASVIDQASPLKKILANVLTFLLTAVGILATIGFVISGIMFVTAAGNSSQSETAKKAMGYTIMGIVIAGAGLLIVKQVLSLAMGQ